MIINTGSRTDIPAFFSEWFYNRIKEGEVLVRNPYYPQQVTRYKLSPDVVDCINFCTKNPQPMLERMSELDKFHQFWFVTITPYGREIEPNVPPKKQVMETFKKLSDLVGVNAVSWRYDPIFINEKYTVDFHLNAFENMAKNLSGYVDSCVVSFIDLYAKTKKNFPDVKEVTKEEQRLITKEFVEIGKSYGIQIKMCCEKKELKQYGADISGCMTKAVIERAIGSALEIPKGRTAARQECECLLGSDIGMYNTCNHGCIYCYANYNREIVVQNIKQHNPKSPFLIGGYREGDIIKDAKQTAYGVGQLMLTF
jgi:hypothetical protein